MSDAVHDCIRCAINFARQHNTRNAALLSDALHRDGYSHETVTEALRIVANRLVNLEA